MAAVNWALQVVIALDQLANSMIPGGYADETLSARAHRMRVKRQRVWGWTADALDTVFFWQRGPGHCERAYLSEVRRRQLPRAYD